MDSDTLLAGAYLSKGIQTEKAISGLKVGFNSQTHFFNFLRNLSQELFEYLRKHKQSEKTNDVKHLKKICALLIKPHMLNSKDEKVQLYLSCCLAEIIRIYAPNAPFKETQLRVIYKGNLF